MYELLHTERIYSPSVHGFTFAAQLVSGRLMFYARLTNGIGMTDTHFEMTDYEWEKQPLILDLGPLYKNVFESNAIQEWVEKTVYPWSWEQKKRYLDRQIEKTQGQLEEAQSLLSDLQYLIDAEKESTNG